MNILAFDSSITFNYIKEYKFKANVNPREAESMLTDVIRPYVLHYVVFQTAFTMYIFLYNYFL